MTVPWAGGSVADVDGVATLALGGSPVLHWRCVPELTVDGVATPVQPTGLTTELDELRYGFAAGPLPVDLRHSLDQTWAIRLAITNPTTTEVRVSGAALRFGCEPGWTAWGLRAGAEASVAALPSAARQPVVGFSLLQGELRGVGEELTLPDLVLAPGGQYVVRLRGETYPDAQHFAVGRHDLLPPAAWVEADDAVRIEHQDLAMVVAPEVTVATTDDGAVELTGDPGQVSRLQLVGPRGTTDLAVGFAPSLPQVLAGLVALGEQKWPVTRQGLRLTEPADGLVVQAFLATGGSTGVSHSVWSEALDGLCARVDEESSLLAVALLARQALLTGDRELTARSAAGLGQLAGEAGAALVAAQVMAASLVTGAEPVPVQGSGAPVADVRAWGAAFGCGLRGEALGPGDPVRDAREVALAQMQLAIDPPRSRGWACGFAELVQRQRRRLLGEAYGDPAAAEAVAWLTLAD